jgi:signal transduction histidine kinase
MLKTSGILILILFSFCVGFSQIGGTNHFRDSLKNELAHAKDDTSRVLIMADLANAYWTKDADSLNKYAYQSLALTKKIKFWRGLASALNAFAIAFQLQGDYPKSLQYLSWSTQISESKDFAYEKAIAYTWRGTCYWFLADYEKSETWYKYAVRLFESIPKNHLVDDWIKLDDLGLGQTYVDGDRLDSAYFYLNKFYNEDIDVFWRPVALYNLGDCLFKLGDRKISFKYLRSSVPGAVSNADSVTVSEACAVLARFFDKIQQPDSAIFYASRGLNAAKQISYVVGMYKNSKWLAKVYEQEDTKQALYYRKIFDSVNEVMYGIKKVQELEEDQRRQQIAQQAEIEKENRLKQFGFLGGLAIMLVIALILYANNQQKKKANRQLQLQKEEIENTLSKLKTTQAQLIQSEKMASLGELTAGIAHEIQNPLNFVNNFSDLNSELIDEVNTAIDSDKKTEAKVLISRLRDNEEKIKSHGKRADAIVKSMLLHSKTSKGKNEETDFNALVDEYLRLAYHGMRAKDQSLTVELKKDLDPTIGKVQLIPQDFGRVLLNLYNNAFYAVAEMAKQEKDHYTPGISITTKKSNGKIEFRVKDNGNGIPARFREKIFQPFFTTKPTGQGTGLGLSLAYDIVKAHGGEIMVDTEEGAGTSFIIQLPN